VEPAAGELVRARVAAVAPETSVAEALALARRRDAVAVAAGRAWILREDLARAAWLGLGALPARAVARPLPVVAAGASEVVVRRHFAAGAPVVVVDDRRRGPVGAVVAPERGGPSGTSLGPRFPDRLPEATRPVLAALRRIAASGPRIFLVGGVVREALRTREPITTPDLDVVVEGDAGRVARALAEAVGAAPGRGLVEHARFMTASVTTAAGARVDVATARSERYEAPGALPRVLPAAIGQDLGRRDFTVNAMAVDLGAEAFDVLDPYGGRWALARRRLRVLHPLSFVEDPTRIFRAARYATRLGFALDDWTTRALRLGLARAPYPALSGQRLQAELALIAREVRPGAALAWLGGAGAFRLLAPGYRWTAAARGAAGRLADTLDWARRAGLAPEPVELVLVAVLAGQRPGVPAAALDRLALQGEPRSRIERALAGGFPPPGTGRPPSERARPWRGRSDLELASAMLLGDAATRREVAWFVAEARAVRPALRGDDVTALGVPPGPEVARVLSALRDARLDGTVVEQDDERALVRNWLRRKEA
jgi:tRNA nucleotidyltransferase (CCA-adding enzyme)